MSTAKTYDGPASAADLAAEDTVDPRRMLLLSMADDELVTGHRASHWTGVAPGLEEDLAFSTLAQDEINHGDLWYQVLLGDQDRGAVDALGLGRGPEEYRHAVLCERPPTDFAFTLARHWLYDRFDAVRLSALTSSSDADIAAVAVRLQHEERYHLEHAEHWVNRVANGGSEAHDQLASGIERVLPEALWLFEPLPGESQMVADGLLPDFITSWSRAWLAWLAPALDTLGLRSLMPDAAHEDDGGWRLDGDLFAEPGGRHGVHSEDWTQDVWPEMTALYRAHPGASW